MREEIDYIQHRNSIKKTNPGIKGNEIPLAFDEQL